MKLSIDGIANGVRVQTTFHGYTPMGALEPFFAARLDDCYPSYRVSELPILKLVVDGTTFSTPIAEDAVKRLTDMADQICCRDILNQTHSKGMA